MVFYCMDRNISECVHTGRAENFVGIEPATFGVPVSPMLCHVSCAANPFECVIFRNSS